MSYSSTSTLSDSVVTTPAFAAFPTPSRISGSFRPSNYLVPSGHRIILVNVNCWFRTAYQTILTTQRFKFRPTKSSQPANTPRMRLHRSNLARSKEVFPRIKYFAAQDQQKWVSTSPPTGTSQIPPYSPPLTSSTLASSSSRNPPFMNESQRANAAQTSPSAPSSATPNTSHSFASSSSSTSYDRRSSADAQVGIGLSLLQDLANGMDSSDEDEDEEDDARRRLRWSVHSGGLGKDG
jgi:hypothetical protein